MIKGRFQLLATPGTQEDPMGQYKYKGIRIFDNLPQIMDLELGLTIQKYFVFVLQSLKQSSCNSLSG